ncbi:hypothetical protein MAPG_05992 [Magnaporthiopsis poae ATCC 64411]|uniref:Uncharacterized protein n=1 Tax=Magnaporthiopsis poae (strain ATCC 64411 / 73-15) TaxID=644358 RepID=A0A0C4E0V5_MAGP6|nr:hypothetical protein MAPG_05992 [Magnaporthiopsis poae ATCC 64411]
MPLSSGGAGTTKGQSGGQDGGVRRQMGLSGSELAAKSNPLDTVVSGRDPHPALEPICMSDVRRRSLGWKESRLKSKQ